MFRYRAAYCAALAAAILFFILFKEYLSFFTLVFILLLPSLSWMSTLCAVRGTTAELRTKNAPAGKDEEFSLYVTLRNTSILPLARAQLRFSCENSLSGEKQEQILFVPVNARSEQTAEYPMRSRCCGRIMARLTELC